MNSSSIPSVNGGVEPKACAEALEASRPTATLLLLVCDTITEAASRRIGKAMRIGCGFLRSTYGVVADACGSFPSDRTVMESYAVLWQEGGAAPVAGRLDFGTRNLTLHGGHRSAEIRVEIPYTDICCVERGRESIGSLRAIRLDSRTRGSMLLATLGGLMLRGEILESLQGKVSAVAASVPLT